MVDVRKLKYFIGFRIWIAIEHGALNTFILFWESYSSICIYVNTRNIVIKELPTYLHM